MHISDFDLEKTVECGQIFRWEKRDGTYYITAQNNILLIRQHGDILNFSAVRGGSSFVKRYLSLDEDYSKIISSLRKDGLPEEVISSAYGLRLIRQDPFECLMSYVASSASNIPRIKRNLNSLCRNFGRRISLGKFSSYSFPGPSEIFSRRKIENSFRKFGFGFRARFYPQIVQSVMSTENSENADEAFKKFFSRIRRMNYEGAKQALTSLPGVGSKVADCVLAFSLGFSEAFPTDVWVRRGVSILFFNGRNISVREAEAFGRRRFGENAAYAQEFIYYWIRNRKKLS